MALPGIRSAIPVKILDISLGGMGCTMQRHRNLVFHEKDFLTLAEFYNLERKRIISNISMEARWVLDAENFANIGLGFRFMDLNDEMKRQFSDFIDQGMNARNLLIQKTDSQEFVKKRIKP